MSDVLLKHAETLREQHHDVQKELAYTAPELITPHAKHWLASTEAFIDLLDYVESVDDPELVKRTEKFATAILKTTDEYRA